MRPQPQHAPPPTQLPARSPRCWRRRQMPLLTWQPAPLRSPRCPLQLLLHLPPCGHMRLPAPLRRLFRCCAAAAS